MNQTLAEYWRRFGVERLILGLFASHLRIDLMLFHLIPKGEEGSPVILINLVLLSRINRRLYLQFYFLYGLGGGFLDGQLLFYGIILEHAMFRCLPAKLGLLLSSHFR